MHTTLFWAEIGLVILLSGSGQVRTVGVGFEPGSGRKKNYPRPTLICCKVTVSK